MPVIVTLDMYSGLPNPSWELTESQAEELAARFSQNRPNTLMQTAASIGLLGYRGFTVKTVADPAPMHFRCFDGIIQTDSPQMPNFIDGDSELEMFLLKTGGPVLRPEEAEFVEGEISKNVITGVATGLPGFKFDSAPVFNPAKWNHDPNVLENNNCYNYANDKITNTFAQPGLGSGKEGKFPPNCAETGAAAERDGEIPVPPPDVLPAEGQYIALVIAAQTQPKPFHDYHWYRQDSDLTWSHKPGSDLARNTDNSGKRITDPRTCNRGLYTIFCGFYHCVPDLVRIR